MCLIRLNGVLASSSARSFPDHNSSLSVLCSKATESRARFPAIIPSLEAGRSLTLYRNCRCWYLVGSAPWSYFFFIVAPSSIHFRSAASGPSSNGLGNSARCHCGSAEKIRRVQGPSAAEGVATDQESKPTEQAVNKCEAEQAGPPRRKAVDERKHHREGSQDSRGQGSRAGPRKPLGKGGLHLLRPQRRIS